MTGSPPPGGATYRDAGVDIEAGDALVERIKPLARATARPGAMGGLGGFGALFDLRAAGFRYSKVMRHWEGLTRFADADALANAHGGTARRVASAPVSAALDTAAE